MNLQTVMSRILEEVPRADIFVDLRYRMGTLIPLKFNRVINENGRNEVIFTTTAEFGNLKIYYWKGAYPANFMNRVKVVDINSGYRKLLGGRIRILAVD